MIDLNLVKRNVQEIITEGELNELVKEKRKLTTYCGYEASGPVHLGTMVAAQKQIDFQNAGLKVKVLLADLHTFLNRKGDEKFIQEQVEFWKNSFIALGLKKAEFVLGSEFQLEENYVKDVLSLSLESTLNRALRSMQEIARDIENARVSQIIYPLMQIADIKALDVDIAHGGMEQRKIHMLARELLPKIWNNGRKPICIHTPLLSSLQGPGQKMSSSKPETIIAVNESAESIKKKISQAFCPKAEKKDNVILQICNYLIFPRKEKFELKRKEKFGGNLEFDSYAELEKFYVEEKIHPEDLKNSVSESLIEILEPVR